MVSQGRLDKKNFVLAITLSCMLLFSPVTALGFKTFENVEKEVRSVFYKTETLITVEGASCVDLGGSQFGCFIQPTVVNENRGYSARTVSGTESPYNITLTYIDEQQAQFNIENDGTTTDPRIFINGTTLQGVALNGINVTLGGNFWIYQSGIQANRIELSNGQQLATSLTVYFPQDNRTAFATLGRSLEGNYLSANTQQNIDKFINYIELMNPKQSKMLKLYDLFHNDREKFYTIILKVLANKLDTSPSELKKGIKQYLNTYNEERNIDLFIQKVKQKIQNVAPQEGPT